MAKIEDGEIVIAVLHSPREKVWGILGEINQAGIYLRGIDLNAFDELVKAIQNKEPFYGLSEQFFPLWRVERITRDEPNGDIPSMNQQFEQRTGILLAQI